MQHVLHKDFAEDLSPYQIASRRQIIALLRNMQERKQLLRLYINQGKEVMMTSILEVDEVSGYLVIDCAPDEVQNQRILSSNRVDFEGTVENVRVLFCGQDLARDQHANLPALSFPLPEIVWRMQRRECYRVDTPITNPVRCLIHADIDGRLQDFSMPLINISIGGLAMQDEQRLLDATVGQLYMGCELLVPDSGSVPINLRIRNTQTIQRENGKTYRRLGCMFTDLDPLVLPLVQRYITCLEREQTARNNGLA